MRDDTACFWVGWMTGFVCGVALFAMISIGDGAAHNTEINDMRDKAIARGAAYWETKGGQAVFTWKSEKAEAQ